MAGLNYYAKLPTYEMPDAPDVWKPISNALVELRKGREADQRNDIAQQQVDLHAQQVAQAQAKANQELEDKSMNQAAGIAQYIHGLKEDDPNKKMLWQNFVDHHPDVAPSLKSSGVDPTDHINGPQFVMSRVAGYQDEQKKALLEAQTAAARSHGSYYDAAAKGLGDRNDIRKQDADTRRLKVGSDLLSRYGSTPPSQEVWDRDSQPGGFLHTAFGGAPPSYADAPRFLQMAQARLRGLPEDADLIERGFSQDAVKTMKRAQDLERAFGKAKVGYHWDIDEKGKPTQVLTAEKEDAKQKKIDTAAPFYMKRLDMASSVLGESSMAGRVIAAAPGGSYLYPQYSEARQLAGHAVSALTAMVEGQRHANAQDVRLLGFFQPAPNDTHEITLFKLNEARAFFKTWMSAKAAGRSDDYISNRFSSAVQNAYDKLLEKEGLNPSAKPGAGKPGTVQGMSNDELLKRLNE